MDILIKGMEMPTGDDDVKLIINSDGSVHRIIGWAVSEKMNAKAIELPPHGRLIDADELEASDAILIGEDAWNMVHNAPTVVEASR